MSANLFAFAVQGVALFLLLSGCHATSTQTQAELPQPTLAPPTEKANTNVNVIPPPIEEPIVIAAFAADQPFDTTEPTTNSIWPALRSGMELSLALNQPRVKQELRWLKNNPGYLERLKPRLQKYLPYLLEQTELRQLPTELALIPIVESALDPYAFSPGGASGPWQFMRPTAEQYGLKINRWYDGRRDIIAATDAALDYLQSLEQRLGHWHLAIAAYNGGGARVARAMKRAGSNDFFQLSLPRETQYYLPRVLALAAVIADPEQFDATLPEIDNIQSFAKLLLPGQFDLNIASQMTGLSYSQLKAWNPALKRWATAAHAPHYLILPTFNADKDSAPLDFVSLKTALSTTTPSQRMRWNEITIQNGDSLSVLAERYNTDVSTLQIANNLTGVSIRAGKLLLVPVNGALSAAIPESDSTSLAYEIRPGDSLWSIARRHNVSITKLVKTNQIAPRDVLRVGRTIHVPMAKAILVSTTGSPNKVIRKIGYKVRKGDSLARIAKRFQVSVRDLAKWNSLDLKRYLQPGQKLTIHVDVVNT
jgi:membrane-bound lytic murein transglycosylase D